MSQHQRPTSIVPAPVSSMTPDILSGDHMPAMLLGAMSGRELQHFAEQLQKHSLEMKGTELKLINAMAAVERLGVTGYFSGVSAAAQMLSVARSIPDPELQRSAQAFAEMMSAQTFQQMGALAALGGRLLGEKAAQSFSPPPAEPEPQNWWERLERLLNGAG